MKRSPPLRTIPKTLLKKFPEESLKVRKTPQVIPHTALGIEAIKKKIPEKFQEANEFKNFLKNF